MSNDTHHPRSDAVCQWIHLHKFFTETRLAVLINYKDKTEGRVSQPYRITTMKHSMITDVHYHRSSECGWGWVCGKPWLPKGHSRPGLSLSRLQFRSSLAVFCRTAWGSSSALSYCLSAPGTGSNGQSPPGSSLTHQESMYVSTTQK